MLIMSFMCAVNGEQCFSVCYTVSGLSRGHWGLSVAVIWFTGGRISEGHTIISCLPLCLSSVIQMCFHLEESLCSVLHRFSLLRQRWSFSPPICLEFPAPLCLHHTGGDRTSWAPFDSAGFTIHLHLSQHTKHTFTLSSKASAASAWEYSLSLSTRGEETPGSLCFWHMLCLHPQLSALSLDSHISDQTQRKCSPRFRWTLTKHWPTSQCLCTTVCYRYDHIRLYDPAVMF